MITYVRSHGLVDRSPPDIVLGGLLLDDTLIGGGTASLSAGVGSQSTAGGDGGTSLVDESIFIESSSRGVGNLCGQHIVDEMDGGSAYDSDSVVVNVGVLMELLLKLSVSLARPEIMLARFMRDTLDDEGEGGEDEDEGEDGRGRERETY